VRETLARLNPLPGRTELQVAVGLAVPEIHAWYRCGSDPQVTESAWRNGLRTGVAPYTKQSLKRAVYGADRPSGDLIHATVEAEGKRLAGEIQRLEEDFPGGFGTMARELRSWLTPLDL
jgi:hypothetical protein